MRVASQPTVLVVPLVVEPERSSSGAAAHADDRGVDDRRRPPGATTTPELMAAPHRQLQAGWKDSSTDTMPGPYPSPPDSATPENQGSDPLRFVAVGRDRGVLTPDRNFAGFSEVHTAVAGLRAEPDGGRAACALPIAGRWSLSGWSGPCGGPSTNVRPRRPCAGGARGASPYDAEPPGRPPEARGELLVSDPRPEGRVCGLLGGVERVSSRPSGTWLGPRGSSPRDPRGRRRGPSRR